MILRRRLRFQAEIDFTKCHPVHNEPHRAPMPKRQRLSKSQSVSPKYPHAPQGSSKKTIPHHQPSQQASPRPWPTNANLLLIGEGDFSFAHSLYTKHRHTFQSLTATCFDSRDGLLQKYPQSAHYIAGLEYATPGDQTIQDEFLDLDDFDNDAREYAREHNRGLEGLKKKSTPATVLYGIDARKLGSYKALKKKSFDFVIFNFPHVGGLSTDVNRQVRHNQSLLVDFFNASKAVLRHPSTPSNSMHNSKPDTAARHGEQESKKQKGDSVPRDGPGGEAGKVMVTLFEREPYTLWNIRDLARHCGFVVERSWKFDWGAWEGYEHARTLGNLRSRQQGGGGGENAGGVEDADNEGDEGQDRVESHKGGSDGIADEMASEMASEIAHGIANEVTNETTDKVVDEPDETVNEMAYEMADKMADEMADQMADEMADKMADEMADEMANEHAKDGEGDEAAEQEEWRGFSDDGDSEGETAEQQRGAEIYERKDNGNRRPGRWRGEDRDARTYLFSLKVEGVGRSHGGKKRKKADDSDSD
ncbi:MAG: hypothetical protein Q9159_004991 [Coniocarpon cinnabarinum]